MQPGVRRKRPRRSKEEVIDYARQRRVQKRNRRIAMTSLASACGKRHAPLETSFILVWDMRLLIINWAAPSSTFSTATPNHIPTRAGSRAIMTVFSKPAPFLEPRIPTKIILILLSYTNSPKPLQGTTNDLELLLRNFDYQHNDKSGRFTVITDIKLEFTDSQSVTQYVAAQQPTRDNIRRVIVSETKRLKPQDSLLLWYGGHVTPPQDPSNTTTAAIKLPAGDDVIFGWQLRKWLSNEKISSTAPITLVLDCCASEDMLGLGVRYGTTETEVVQQDVLSKPIRSNLTVISAARSDQFAYSYRGDSEQKMNGILTWYVLSVMFNSVDKEPIRPIEMMCSKVVEVTSKKQEPVVTSSRVFPGGLLPVFDLHPGSVLQSNESVTSMLRLAISHQISATVYIGRLVIHSPRTLHFLLALLLNLSNESATALHIEITVVAYSPPPSPPPTPPHLPDATEAQMFDTSGTKLADAGLMTIRDQGLDTRTWTVSNDQP